MPITMHTPSHHTHQGLTLVETLMTVAVVSILVAFTVPTFGTLYDKYRVRQEERIQLEIYDALLRFAADYNALPADNNANPMCSGSSQWYDCLTSELDYSSDQIRYDVWGEERRYVSTTRTKAIAGETLTLHYASLHSKGADKRAAATAGIPASGADYAATSSVLWWANMAGVNVLTTFETLKPDGDDVAIKLTDSILKVEKLKETQERLEAIKQALYDFEQVQYVTDLQSANAVISDEVDSRMHYPVAQQTAAADNVSARYGTALRAATGGRFSGDRRIENRAATVQQHRNRRNDMVALMRMIGLPDSYCCSEIDIEENAATSTDYTQRQPFFYYANPRDMVNGVCSGTRPTQIPFAPAIIQRNQRLTSGNAICD